MKQHAQFWQEMFLRDKVMWNTVEGGADWCDNDWRERYMRQHHLNQRTKSQQSSKKPVTQCAPTNFLCATIFFSMFICSDPHKLNGITLFQCLVLQGCCFIPYSSQKTPELLKQV